MFDPFTSGLDASAHHSALAPLLVFCAGAASSIGPCAASRFIAIGGLSSDRSRGQAVALAAACAAGIAATYVAFGLAGSLLFRAAFFSRGIYAALALGLAASGLWGLWKEPPRHAHAGEAAAPSLGKAFVLGSSSSLVLSPCCAPMLFGIIAYTSSLSGPGYTSLLLAVFALGHAVPVFAAGLGACGLSVLLKRCGSAGAGTVVGSTLSLALAGYYGILA